MKKENNLPENPIYKLQSSNLFLKTIEISYWISLFIMPVSIILFFLYVYDFQSFNLDLTRQINSFVASLIVAVGVLSFIASADKDKIIINNKKFEFKIHFFTFVGLMGTLLMFISAIKY